MTGIRTGGSAYPQSCLEGYGMGPVTIDESEVFDVRGMTLRDHFAGKALVGLVCGEANEPLQFEKGQTIEQALAASARRRAVWSYQQADAMIAVRDEVGSDPAEEAVDIRELREALKPIVDFVDRPAVFRAPDSFIVTMGSSLAARQITAGDLRRVAALVRKEKG